MNSSPSAGSSDGRDSGVKGANPSTRPLLILVSVAPFDPYPSLYASGPESTWVRETVHGVVVCTFSASPLTTTRKQLSDLREMLRSGGAPLGALGGVDVTAPLLRLYGAVATAAADKSGGKAFKRLKALTAKRSILVVGGSVKAWERYVLSPVKDRRRPRVTTSGTHLTVHHPATLSNSLANQFALFTYLANGEPIAGVVFATSSAYVDQQRLAAWCRQHRDGFVVGGSNALEDRGGMGHPFMSGFCQYFSWDAICTLAKASGFDHSDLNDGALTSWLVKRGIRWVDPGIVWFTDELDAGLCPLCENPAKTVVRCTSHGARPREAELMRQLDHLHRGDQPVGRRGLAP